MPSASLGHYAALSFFVRGRGLDDLGLRIADLKSIEQAVSSQLVVEPQQENIEL